MYHIGYFKDTKRCLYSSNKVLLNAYLSQIQNGGSCPISPLMATFWTRIPCLPKAMHDRLQNGSKGGYSYSSPDENSMLSVENLTCWGTKRSVDIYLQLSIKHIHKNRWLICRILFLQNLFNLLKKVARLIWLTYV